MSVLTGMDFLTRISLLTRIGLLNMIGLLPGSLLVGSLSLRSVKT